MKNKPWIDTLLKIIGIVVTLLLIAFIIWGTWSGTFLNEDKLTQFVKGFGFWGPLIVCILTISQVIIPVLPGGIGLLPGTLLYGPWIGFLINYIGVVLGSIVAFLLARIYGMKIIYRFFSPKMIEKYEKWLTYQKQFDRFFTVAIFLPIAPDDFLCYLAGTTKMSLKKFVIIILLGKPLALIFYTFGLNEIYHKLFSFFG